jgi:S1-C subfamily serine protease
MRFTTIMLAAFALGSMAGTASAQTAKAKDKAEKESSVRTYYRSSGNDDRAALGVNTTASGRRDTLGLLIQSVVPNSPAEKAGLEEGNRIVSINGVSLQLSRADAGERDMDGVMTRRLIRELRKITPGQDAELRVYANGQTKTVRVKTVDTEELNELEHRANRRMDVDEDERAVVGLNFGGGSSKRDTLGIFIVSITEDGPAAKAGLEEGNRIAAINGQDLRVSREDAGDGYMMNAKANRFRRVMRTVKPGETVDLRIYANGQFRNVKITTVASSDLYRNSRSFGMFNEGGTFVFPRVVAPATPRAPRPPVILRPGRMTIDLDEDDLSFDLSDDVRIAIEGAAEAARTAVEGLEPALSRAAVQAERAAHDAARALGGVRIRAPRSASTQDGDDRCRSSNGTEWREVSTSPSRSYFVSGFGATYTLKIPGLCVTKVNADLASYFGNGAERGLLVLEADSPFDKLRAGDILLSVNGQSVRNGDKATLKFDTDAANTIEFLRKGKKMTAEIDVVEK